MSRHYAPTTNELLSVAEKIKSGDDLIRFRCPYDSRTFTVAFLIANGVDEAKAEAAVVTIPKGRRDGIRGFIR